MRIIIVLLVGCLIQLSEQGRRNSKQKDKPSNRKYSRWENWSPCPPACRFSCYPNCVQIRYKKCIRPEICQKNVLKDERTCGRCETPPGQLVTNSPDTGAPPIPNKYLAIRAQEDDVPMVQLSSHCLPDYHFSSWGNWSECFDVCRRVRFRHCTTSLCTDRVPHMEDAAVKQEEWCVPTKKPNGQAEINCEQYLTYMKLVSTKNSDLLELRQCEIARRKISTQKKEKVKAVSKMMPEGSILDLGVSCGLRNLQQRNLRIIGGKAAKKGHWPWQVAIMIDKKKNDFSDFPRHQHLFNPRQYFNYTEDPSYVQYCGGTLINNEWVLTAAHCVKQRETGLRKPNMVVMVGETDMRVMKDKDDSWLKNIYKISKVIDHSRFEWESVNNDIALLKLEKPVPNTPDLGFSCVPEEDLEVSPGTECMAVGWGKHKKYPKQRASKRLKEAVLPLVSRQECKSAFNFSITKNQMCAGYEDGRSDSCDGDSGGPLLCLSNTPNGNRWVIYGITSFGSNDGCGIAGKYGVYTKVNNYSKWIKFAIETGEQLHESQHVLEERKRRHRKQNRRRDKNKATVSLELPLSTDKTLSFMDSLNQPARRNHKNRDRAPSRHLQNQLEILS